MYQELITIHIQIISALLGTRVETQESCWPSS